MRDEMSKYPTIMNLKSVEKEIETLIKAYDQGHITYLRSLKHKHHKKAKSTLSSLKKVNNLLLTYVKKGQSLLKKAISEGSLMQHQVAYSMPKLKRIAITAKKQNMIIRRLNDEMSKVDGELDNSSLEYNANNLQYIFIFLATIIIIIITIKSYVSDKSSILDNIILITITVVILYLIIKKNF